MYSIVIKQCYPKEEIFFYVKTESRHTLFYYITTFCTYRSKGLSPGLTIMLTIMLAGKIVIIVVTLCLHRSQVLWVIIHVYIATYYTCLHMLYMYVALLQIMIYRFTKLLNLI